jgi:uncharacterized membrane protein
MLIGERDARTGEVREGAGTAFLRLRRDDRGVTAVLVALTLAALIGFTALGVETGLWYVIKRQNQSAADVAALSGAFELLAGQSNGLSANTIYPDICNLAKRDAARNNFAFNSFSCPSTTPACTNPSSGQMCANNPPVLGGAGVAGNNNAVEVILSQQQNSFLASLSLPSVTIDTRRSRPSGCSITPACSPWVRPAQTSQNKAIPASVLHQPPAAYVPRRAPAR